jgi:glycine/D-amino acid oxidase-like deaminating enzyme
MTSCIAGLSVPKVFHIWNTSGSEPGRIVVGGGIAGTTVAWELARRGTRVELFEQATLAAGASGRNTGTLLHQVEPVVAAMLRESEERYRELQDGDVDFRWTQREELLLARDPVAWSRRRRRSSRSRESQPNP